MRLIGEMSSSQIWTRYVRYIGAGAVAMAGLITLARSIPTIIESFRVGAAQLRARLEKTTGVSIKRTDFDVSLRVVGVGALIIGILLAVVPQIFGIEATGFRVLAAVLVVIFAFFFVTVSSRIVGLVGVTSNPTSGMAIATLLGTSALFLGFGWTDELGMAAAITVGCVVTIAASIAGDTSQDLKTGFLLGATPFRQQRGEMIGVLTCAVFVAGTLLVIGEAWGFGNEEIPAPQATLMKVVVEGVLGGSLPWGLVAIGVGIAIIVELLGIPSLAFSVGVYLPVSTMVPIYFGGFLRQLSEKRASSKEDAEARREQGVLFGSGLVGGEGLFGVLIAGYAAITSQSPEGIGHVWAGPYGQVLSAIFFAGLMWYFYRLTRRKA
jgi:putative OPT family oligopeptide transporter